MSMLVRGGSRIPHRRGRQPSRTGAPAYKFARISKKLQEMKNIFVRRWWGSATASEHADISQDVVCTEPLAAHGQEVLMVTRMSKE